MYEICKKNHTLIVSDEIHGDIVYAPHKHIPYFSLSDEVADHVVVMGSPSKTFNLACFYSAYVVIKNKVLRDQNNAVYDNYHFDYNYIGIEALVAAYDKCEYYVDQQNEYFLKNINLVKNFIACTAVLTYITNAIGSSMLFASIVTAALMKSVFVENKIAPDPKREESPGIPLFLMRIFSPATQFPGITLLTECRELRCSSLPDPA